MRIKATIILLLIVNLSSHATFIKGKATIYTLPSRTPFAVLYDSCFVSQSWNYKWKQPFVDFDGFVKKTDITNGRINKDTVYLYSDATFKHITGFTWRTDSSMWIHFQEPDKYLFPHLDSNYLKCWLYGGIDSSFIWGFDPWNSIIHSVAEDGTLFKVSFPELNNLMYSIHNYCTDISGKGIEYSETYDEDNPTPGIGLLYFFQDGILKALWTTAKLKIKNSQILERGYLYFDDSVEASISTIRTKFKERLDYTP